MAVVLVANTDGRIPSDEPLPAALERIPLECRRWVNRRPFCSLSFASRAANGGGGR